MARPVSREELEELLRELRERERELTRRIEEKRGEVRRLEEELARARRELNRLYRERREVRREIERLPLRWKQRLYYHKRWALEHIGYVLMMFEADTMKEAESHG